MHKILFDSIRHKFPQDLRQLVMSIFSVYLHLYMLNKPKTLNYSHFQWKLGQLFDFLGKFLSLLKKFAWKTILYYGKNQPRAIAQFYSTQFTQGFYEEHRLWHLVCKVQVLVAYIYFLKQMLMKKYFVERHTSGKGSKLKAWTGLISVQVGGIKIHSILGCFVPT